MRLTVFNGSPKKGSNNTELLVKKFIDGFTKAPGSEYGVCKLNSLNSMDEAVDLFKKSEYIILAFPLYTYSMPAGVKAFIESLETLCGACGGKKIGFIVQYGFVEAIHARPLEKYLEMLAGLLKCEYLGTIIRGGCDGLARNPEAPRSKKTLKGIYEIGGGLGETGRFDRRLIDKYSKPETQALFSRLFMKSFVKFANKHYWGAELRKNGVFDESFARPYIRKY